nr:MAG TPA: hypothetical protein [Caudoviricetes sp.]
MEITDLFLYWFIIGWGRPRASLDTNARYGFLIPLVYPQCKVARVGIEPTVLSLS